MKEGHVRVDVLYTNFSEKNKALVNLIRKSNPWEFHLCLTIFLKGMACKQCVLNQPIMNFETSQNQGMNIKYLMAGFLIIFALTMLIQFVIYFLRNLEILKEK